MREAITSRESIFMRHYEVVFLVHPDRSDQVQPMIQRYIQIIEKDAGRVHRLEQHSRQLAYPIQRVRKATYVLMNIECDQPTQQALEESFVFNDAVIRHAFFKQSHAITEPSILTKDTRDKKKDSVPVATKSAPVIETTVQITEAAQPDALEIEELVEETIETEGE